MKKHLLYALLIMLTVSACSKVPFTGRKQVKLLPSSSMNSMSLSAYNDFLKENPPVTSGSQYEMVQRVGKKIQKATELYFRDTGHSAKLANYAWKFNYVDDPTVNAWCMPGGRVVVYSGIMNVAQNEDGLAVVMGHEIAHAIAHHGNERMSQGLAVQMGGMGLQVALSQKPEATQNLFLGAYGLGTQVGMMLPFSRKHESEADEIGLYLMAIAGYNPEAAAPFWSRMSAGGGQTPPAFLSTHPAPDKRAATLKSLVAKAQLYGRKYKGKVQ